MTRTLLKTKFYIPHPRSDLVPRSRLAERFNLALENGQKFILISAPAGFGKTTLLSSWVADVDQSVAWISLDQSDNDPGSFLSYLVTSLQQIKAEIGASILELLDSPHAPPLKALLAELVNEICQLKDPFLLIFDDYHLISNQHIHDAVRFLLNNMPPPMHLVLSSRIDPPWQLTRMRGRGELFELRSADLRFTTEEVVEFLNAVMNLQLSGKDIKRLDTRTEGWIAGLQMAALSMGGQKDSSSFIEAFSASNRYILDYLIEEVLNQRPPATREFLLRTSILTRLSAPLCDALLKVNNSQKTLMELERNNLFLFPLDDERRWYRYHHLFGDLLQQRLRQTHPDLVKELHRSAGVWYEGSGFVDEAITHSLDGEDYDRAAQLMESLTGDIIRLNKERSFDRWLYRLPQEKIREWPWLALSRARARRADTEESLRWVEEALERSSFEQGGIPDRYSAADKQKMAAFIATSWSHLALVEGDIHRATKEAEKALTLLPAGDSASARLLIALGGIHWANGDRAAAENSYRQAVTAGRKSETWQFVVTALCYVGLQQFKLGHLHAAREYYQEALAAAVRPDGFRMLIEAFPLIRLGDLLREWNQLPEAESYLEPGFERALRSGYRDLELDAHICMTRMHLARRREEEALRLALEADRLIDNHKVDPYLICWADECLLRMLLARGELDAALHKLEKRELTVDGVLSCHHDLHHINLARVLIAQGVQNPTGTYLSEAQLLLRRLFIAAEKAKWTHEKIKIVILQALALHALGQLTKAMDVLVQALTLAEPGGYMRLFLDEGAPLGELLSRILALPQQAKQKLNQRTREYAGRLVTAMEAEDLALPAPGTSISATLIEPLSDRELEVLRLLPSHLTSTEIAGGLNISANTVRFHIKNIYSKMNVHRRSDAVQAAYDLGLL